MSDNRYWDWRRSLDRPRENRHRARRTLFLRGYLPGRSRVDRRRLWVWTLPPGYFFLPRAA